MPNQRACIPCKYPAAHSYLRRRMSEGADLPTIRHELGSAYRMQAFGYKKGPTLGMLQKHLESHTGAAAPASSASPVFAGGSESTPSSPARPGDVATTIQ